MLFENFFISLYYENEISKLKNIIALYSECRFAPSCSYFRCFLKIFDIIKWKRKKDNRYKKIDKKFTACEFFVYKKIDKKFTLDSITTILKI